MKNRRLLPLFLSASLVSALGFGAVSLPSASAQPPAPAGKAGKKGRARGARGGLPKRMATKIEEQMGKPLTADQKTRLDAAYKARAEATKALNVKFMGEVSNVTGMTMEQVAEINKRGPRGGGKMATPAN